MRTRVVSLSVRVVVGLILVLAVGCSTDVPRTVAGPDPTPSATPSASPSVAPAASPSAKPTGTPAGTPRPTPDAAVPTLIAVSLTRSDCPDGICSWTEVWSDGSVRRDQEGSVSLSVGAPDDVARLLTAIDAFPADFFGFLVEPGMPLLCQPELDDGGQQVWVLRGGRFEIVDTCRVEGGEVDDLLAAVSGVANRSTPIDPYGPRPLVDIDLIGGCDMIGSCPDQTLWNDGRWARWQLDRSEGFYDVTFGSVAPEAAATLAARFEETDFDELRDRLGPGTCHACVDGINSNVDIHVGGDVVSFSDVEHQLVGEPLFDELYALLGDVAPNPALATIRQLNGAAVATGRYVTTGHLAYADRCGYCPPGAACEPCAGPTVSVLSERPDLELLDDGTSATIVDQLERTELLLNVNLENEGELVAGRRYELIVDLTDQVLGDHRVAQVLSFRPLT